MQKAKAAPKFERVHCNMCGQKTKHRLLKVATDRGREEQESAGEVSWETTNEMLECCGCANVVLRRTDWFSEDPDLKVRYFPPAASRTPPRWDYKLPTSLQLLLDEVYRSLDADNVRLPMMGARALIDMVATEKVGDVGSFGQKLKKLENDGFVSPKNREVLEAALDVGSAAAHRGHAVSASQANDVMDIVENLLQAVYVFSDVARKLKQTTPPRKKR